MLSQRTRVSPMLLASSLALGLSVVITYASAAHGRQLLQYDAVAETTATATTPTSLSVVDITLESPHSATTCGATQIEWSWDRSGTPPDVPVTLSIINATDFGSRRKRSSNRHFGYDSDLFLLKRAVIEGVPLQWGSNLPFDQMSFQWDAIKVRPGNYRLLLTIVASDESVVSDPFTVSEGRTESCLYTISSTSSTPDSSSASRASTSSTSTTVNAPATATSSVGSNNGSSSVADSASPTSSGINSGSQNQDGPQDHKSHSSSNTGAIVAGVLVPLLFLIGGGIAFLWRRKRQDSLQSSEKPSGGGGEAWYQGLFGSGSSGSKTPMHRRQISGPEMASAAGLASVAKLVPAALRTEKDEAALNWSASNDRGTPVRRDTGAESEASYGSDRERQHWVDFDIDEAHNVDGARPLSPSTIDSQGLSVIGGNQQLYAQGQNVHLSQWSAGSSAVRDSAASSNDYSRSSIATFSSVASTANGRNLLASASISRSQGTGDDSAQTTSLRRTDSASSSSGSGSSPFGDEHATSSTSPASTDVTTLERSDSSATAKMARSDSTSSRTGIKRKPVPRLSGSAPARKTQGDATHADPFSNANAIDGSSSVEVLRTPTETNSIPSTPPRMPFRFHAATPSSIPETAFSDTLSVHRHTPDLPSSVTSDTLSSSDRGGVESRGDYHLSINLGSENGFRMSFN